MPYWVLIILALTGNGVSVSHVPFDTEKNCLEAAIKFKEDVIKVTSTPIISVTCAPTGR